MDNNSTHLDLHRGNILVLRLDLHRGGNTLVLRLDHRRQCKLIRHHLRQDRLTVVARLLQVHRRLRITTVSNDDGETVAHLSLNTIVYT